MYSSKHPGSNKTVAVDSFNKNQYSINDPASLWAVVNKGRKLPADYVPANLVNPKIPLRLPAGDLEMTIRSDAAGALLAMNSKANTDNIHFMLASAYRSYSLQVSVYGSYVRSIGQAQADQSSARPGFSEHQTGLAADLEPQSRKCEVDPCFGATPEGKWLAENSYKYGFVVRYQNGKQNLTGYEYEPWHIRYVGVELAKEVHQTNQTLEQFFNLPPSVNYPAEPYQL